MASSTERVEVVNVVLPRATWKSKAWLDSKSERHYSLYQDTPANIAALKTLEAFEEDTKRIDEEREAAKRSLLAKCEVIQFPNGEHA